MIAAILMAACTFTGPASAQVNMQEANTAIAEFNMQDLSTDLQDKESQGYVFMAQNALDSNNALKDELRMQIAQAQTIGDVELAETLQDGEIFSQIEEELNSLAQNNTQSE